MTALAGLTVIVSRPGPAGERLSTVLAARGARVCHLPAIAIIEPADLQPLDHAIATIAEYNWVVFTSVNAVERFTARAARIGSRLATAVPPRLAAIGPATASAVRAAWRTPELVGDGSSADSLAMRLGVRDGTRVLFPASAIARDALPTILERAGAKVQLVAAYRTVPGPALAEIGTALVGGDVDAVVFASPSAVQNASDAVQGLGAAPGSVRAAAVCLGHTTAAAARDAGFPLVVVADAPTDEAIAQALAQLEVVG